MSDLEETYRQYLSAINARDFSAVADFANLDVKHNGRSMSDVDYAEYIKESLVPFEDDMIFDVDQLLVSEENEQVACRIRFVRGKPDAETFYEHVFYKFRHGKISEVWSMVELPKN